MSNPRIPEEILNKSIDDFLGEGYPDCNFSVHVRLTNALNQAADRPIKTVRELLCYHRSTFTLAPNLGRVSIRELDRALTAHSLDLPHRKGEPPFYRGVPCPLLEQRNDPERTDGDLVFSLALHESYQLDATTTILRVPGGWIYQFAGYNRSHCFVPERN